MTMVSAPEDMARATCRESYVTRAVRAISRANSSASRVGSISFMGSERYASEVSYVASRYIWKELQITRRVQVLIRKLRNLLRRELRVHRDTSRNSLGALLQHK